jgi:hypothetical protein
MLCKSYSSRAMAQAVSRRSLIGGPGSYPGQSMWDLWWTKWHWGRLSLSFFSFLLSMSFHHVFHAHISPEGWGIGPLVAAVQRHNVTPLTSTTKTGPVQRVEFRRQLIGKVLRFVLRQVGSRGSSGNIVSDYGLDDRAIGVRSPAEAKGFFL